MFVCLFIAALCLVTAILLSTERLAKSGSYDVLVEPEANVLLPPSENVEKVSRDNPRPMVAALAALLSLIVIILVVTLAIVTSRQKLSMERG